MTSVLIAVDGSQESNDAAEFAHRLLGDTVDYLVVTVAETGALVGPLIDAAAYKGMQSALEKAKAAGGTVTGGARVEAAQDTAFYVRPALV